MFDPREPRTTNRIERGKGKARVYCAGPMFSPAEKWEAVQIGQALNDAGYEIFLPQEDGIELKKLVDKVKSPDDLLQVMSFHPTLRQAIYALDFYLVLKWCDALVFNMNGRIPDEGGVVEATGAYVSGKAVVLYKDTPVSFISGEDNPMLDGLDENLYNCGTVESIPDEVALALKELVAWDVKLPPQTKEPLELGEKIWEMRLALDLKDANGREDGKGWTGDLEVMIKTFPLYIEFAQELQVDAAGRIYFAAVEPLFPHELELGILRKPSARLADFAKALWLEFRERVYATMHGAGHGDKRSRKIGRKDVPGCPTCDKFYRPKHP